MGDFVFRNSFAILRQLFRGREMSADESVGPISKLFLVQ